MTTNIELIQTSALKGASASNNTNREEDEKSTFLQQEVNFNGPHYWVSVESIINRLSKWIVSGLFAAVILIRHDPEAVWIVMGSVLNAMLSVGLKKVFNQERPFANLRSDPGMPSSHAMSIFFIFTFVIMSITEWLGVNKLSFAVGTFLLASASYLTWLRVSQKLHTLSQVVVGAIFGTAFLILWYSTWIGVVQQAFESSLLVQIVVLLGAAGFSFGFLLYVVKNWFNHDR
ncbi:hypothetical protein ACFE04_022816 [Oxalis oulophora]